MAGALSGSFARVGGRTMVGARGQQRPASKNEMSDVVLVVEDEVLVRMALANDLRNAGHTVIEASNAHDALEVLHRISIAVRLILSDVIMPGTIDGVELARTVRSKFPTIKIVLTSANLTNVDWVEHDGFFPKPYDATQIIKHVKALLGTEERLSSSPG
jgi:two-component system, response regulator PdtaR